MLCGCGCEKDAGVYRLKYSRTGEHIEGTPKRFLQGHSVERPSTHCKNGHLRSENSTEHGKCKACHRIRDARWKRNNPVARLAIARKHAYGLTSEKYQEMLLQQGNRCLCCSVVFSPESKLTTPCVDHDHECCPGYRSCGKCIRGIICYGCNVMLGFAKDNPEILQAAIQYLKETQCNQNSSSELNQIAQTVTA